MSISGSQKCAVLLCKLSDTQDKPVKDPSFFWDLFTHRGSQSLNDYFINISLNNINLDGSKIFGWRTIPFTTKEIIAKNREDKIYCALPYFPEVNSLIKEGISPFSKIITIYNGDVKDGGTPGPRNGVLVNFDGINETFLAHELGHNFGLNHSYDLSDRKDASWSGPGEYFDNYDIMSAMNVFSVKHPVFGLIGPRLCALYVDQEGWMPSDKKFYFSHKWGSTQLTIDLKSMSHPEQPGYIMIYLDDNYTIEFRTKEGYDASIPNPTILIHKIKNGLAYLEMSDPATFNHEWHEGDTWIGSGPSDNNHFIFLNNTITYTVHVDKYSPETFNAQITISATVNENPYGLPSIIGQIIGGIAVDGGGYIIVNGNIKRIPPRGPEYETLKSLYESPSIEIEGHETSKGV